MHENPQIAVIGAGVAGLTCASNLARAGTSVVVLDKGRGPGGRISTRGGERFGFDHFRFDHGAPFFTARDERFVEAVAGWLDAGVVDRWRPRVMMALGGRLQPDPRPHEFLVGAPRMASLAEHLADGLDVRCSTEVAAVQREGDAWSLRDDGGTELLRAQRVVVTAPAPQAARLLAADPSLASQAARVEMVPCWSVMLGFGEPLPADFDAVFFGEGALGWAVREASKPGRPDTANWVLHGSDEWSSRHVDLDPQRVIDDLYAVFESYLDRALPEPVHSVAHRWRFARPDPGLGEGCLISNRTGMSAAGDWCSGPRVENAWLSGMELASKLLATGRASA